MTGNREEATPRTKKETAAFNAIRKGVKDDLKQLSDPELNHVLLAVLGGEIRVVDLITTAARERGGSDYAGGSDAI